MPETITNLYGESHLSANPPSRKTVHTDHTLLQTVLRRAGHPPTVKVLTGSELYTRQQKATGNFRRERWMPVEEVLQMVRCGDRFSFTTSANHKRVIWIRSLRLRRNEIGPWSKCFRTAEASVLPPSPEWIKKMNANTDSFTRSMIYGKSEKREPANSGFSIRKLGRDGPIC